MEVALLGMKSLGTRGVNLQETERWGFPKIRGPFWKVPSIWGVLWFYVGLPVLLETHRSILAIVPALSTSAKATKVWDPKAKDHIGFKVLGFGF